MSAIMSHIPSKPFAALIACALVLTACGRTASSVDEPTRSDSGDLMHAVVQIVAFVDGEPAWWGSGSIISSDGLVLTNAHVVSDSDLAVERLEIGLTQESDTAPELQYRGEIVAGDDALDLALVRIVDRLDGGDLPTSFPFVAIGDSDAIEIGEALRIFGYPGIGGETITLTTGQVSGFTSEAGLGRRAWIKTDATIAGGNSGGLAADSVGRLVGIPSIVGAGTDAELVDCRPVTDTNRDGTIDDSDDCMPLGGFLNGLRPIALAKPMLDAVLAGDEYRPIAALPSPDPNHSQPSDDPATGTDNVYFSDPIFAADVSSDDQPVEEDTWFPARTPRVCAFWDYEGMDDGMAWSAVWSIDGEIVEDISFLDDRWNLEENGVFWVCADQEDGFGVAVLDVALSVEDQVMSTGFVHMGRGEEVVTLTFTNQGDETVCYLFAAPSVSSVWGPDRLGPRAILDPGEQVEVALQTDSYDIAGDDCDGAELFDGQFELTEDTGLAFDGVLRLE